MINNRFFSLFGKQHFWLRLIIHITTLADCDGQESHLFRGLLVDSLVTVKKRDKLVSRFIPLITAESLLQKINVQQIRRPCFPVTQSDAAVFYVHELRAGPTALIASALKTFSRRWTYGNNSISSAKTQQENCRTASFFLFACFILPFWDLANCIDICHGVYLSIYLLY